MIEIRLTQGKVTCIDEIDSDLSLLKWCAVEKRGTFYASRNMREGRSNIELHRLIMSRVLGRVLVKGEYVDHKDNDSLNNLRSNLRLATNAQNLANRGAPASNTSGYKGVLWRARMHKWEASIKTNGKRIYLGCFKNILDAARAYNEAALKYHGEFARLNPIGDE